MRKGMPLQIPPPSCAVIEATKVALVLVLHSLFMYFLDVLPKDKPMSGLEYAQVACKMLLLGMSGNVSFHFVVCVEFLWTEGALL